MGQIAGNFKIYLIAKFFDVPSVYDISYLLMPVKGKAIKADKMQGPLKQQGRGNGGAGEVENWAILLHILQKAVLML